METVDTIPIFDVVHRIATLNEGIRTFWSSSSGWAPISSTQLLSKSRLDWQVSLSWSLRHWLPEPSVDEAAATQILAYANLGSLVEGSMKLFLSVYLDNYLVDDEVIVKYGKIQSPDGVSMEPLKKFFEKTIWETTPVDNWTPWIAKIQGRRNAIHAFKTKEIGNHADLLQDIRTYLKLLRRLNRQLPYPDHVYEPQESHSFHPNVSILDSSAPQE